MASSFLRQWRCWKIAIFWGGARAGFGGSAGLRWERDRRHWYRRSQESRILGRIEGASKIWLFRRGNPMQNRTMNYWYTRVSTDRRNMGVHYASLEAVMDLGVSNPHILSYGSCSQILPV